VYDACDIFICEQPGHWRSLLVFSFFVLWSKFIYRLLFLDLVNNKIHVPVMWDWWMITERARLGKTYLLSQVEGLWLVNVFCFESRIRSILGLSKVLTEGNYSIPWKVFRIYRFKLWFLKVYLVYSPWRQN
jgi:hypothetical protein